jgi:hypothetical protein
MSQPWRVSVPVYVLTEVTGDQRIKGVYTDPCETRVRFCALVEETKQPHEVLLGQLHVGTEAWVDKGETS